MCYIVLDVNTHLKEVLDKLIDVYDKWKELGLVLGVRNGKLKQIKNDEHNDKSRMWATIEVWLKSSKATWNGLIKALEDQQVEEEDVAKAIKKEIKLKAQTDFN